MASDELLTARALFKTYEVRHGFGRAKQVRAVDRVDLDVRRGETHALVGESGCGKSTLARLLLLAEKPTAGTIHFKGRDLLSLNSAGRRWYRAQVQIVMQDPYTAMNPRQRVESIVGEPLEVNTNRSAKERRLLIHEILELVGLNSRAARNFPHEFSGGQRQRIALARALVLRPAMVVLDEPVSSLDVSIRAQILNLLADTQRELQLTYLLISHDLAVVRHVATRTSVMYLGKIVELGETETLFQAPRHPYTKALLDAVPVLSGRGRRVILSGEPGSAIALPSGCAFHPRCPLAIDRCSHEEPPLLAVDGHSQVACHLDSERHQLSPKRVKSGDQ